jgi:hypothetical protein
MPWQFPQTAPFPWTDGVSGTIPHAADYQAIATDIQTWGGSVNAQRFGLANAGYITLVPGELPGDTYTVSSVSWSGGQATYAVTASHNLQVGQIVSISGMAPSGYNATFVPIVSVPNSTSLVIAVTTNPGAATTMGTVLVGGFTPAMGTLAINVVDNSLRQYGSGGWVAPSSVASSLSVNTYPAPSGLNFYVNGSVGWKVTTLTVVNGANGLINIGNDSAIYLVGPTAAFSVGGFTGGADGRILTLMNASGQAITINHGDSTVPTTSRIFVPAGVSAVLGTYATATFQYTFGNSNWWLMSAH